MEYYYGSGPRIIRPGLDAELMGVSFGTWGVYNDRRRFVSAGQAAELEGRDDVDLTPVYDDRVEVRFPGKYDWGGNVHLTFWYFQHFVSGVSPIGERLTVDTKPYDPGELPTLQSTVAITPRGGSLTAWPRTERRAQSEEALVIVDAVRRLKSAKENAS